MNRIALLACALAALTVVPCPAQADQIEDALKTVRDVRADMFSRQSSVLGELPSPAEYAAAALRARPVPHPDDYTSRTLQLGSAGKAKLMQDVAAFDKAVGKSRSRSFPVIPLGVTGAQVREVVGHALFRVYDVLPKTPADGQLREGDVIVGANGKLFQDRMDPRPELGFALAASQSARLKGIVAFHVVRDGQVVNVEVSLGCTDYYSETWPFDCKKSDLLRKQTLDVVVHNEGDRLNFWTPMYLMASGDAAALEKARRMLYAMIPTAEEAENINGSSWSTSYRLINLCEYYLLTGDSAVMPAIKRCARIIEYNQFPSGGWSHGHGGGYGEITNVGLPSLMGLILARECGLKVDESKIARSVWAFGAYCGTNFPYGMGTGGAGRSGRMDNGMNSMAAIIFHLLGEREMSLRWARSVCYMWMGRDRGHAEGMFSMAWGPLGASLAPPEEFHMFMNQMIWHYELGRASDGGMMFLRKGRWDYPVNQTAAVGLFLHLPQKRLRILGAEKSVFASPAPTGLEKALQAFRDKNWLEFERALAASGKADTEPGRALQAAYDRIPQAVQFALAAAEKSLRENKTATAMAQLDAARRLAGTEYALAKSLRARLPERPQDARPEAKPVAAGDGKWRRQKPALPGNDGGFACDPDYISRTYANGLKGLAPEQIARFLAHFNGGPAGGAAMALADQGPKAAGLIEKLLRDTNPYIRAGAVNALANQYNLTAKKPQKGAPAGPEVDYRPVIAKLDPIANDSHPEVQRALMGVVNAAKVESDATHAIAVAAAANPDPTVQSGAVKAAGWLTDEAVATKIGMSVIKFGRSTGAHDLAKAYNALHKRKQDARAAIPTIVWYFNEEAHLNRGFFTNSPLERGLAIIDHHFDAEIEKMPGLVSALAHAFNRVPYVSWAGWVRARKQAMALMERLSPASAQAMAKAAAGEKRWVQTEDPEILDKATQMSDAAKRTDLLMESVKYLEEMAAWLQAGKPENGKPQLGYDPADPQGREAAKKAREAQKKAEAKRKAAEEKARKAARAKKSGKNAKKPVKK